MTSPPKQFLSHMVTIVSVAVIVLVGIILLADNRRLSQDVKKISQGTQKLAEDNQRLSEQIREQTDINQRYLRCILLIPREDFASVETRVEAIDKCARESKLPDGKAVGEQPTTGDATNTSESSGPSSSTPSNTSQGQQPTQSNQPSSPSQPSLLDQVTKPLKDLIGL